MRNALNPDSDLRFVHICVVCWGKLPNSAEMATHRLSCKMANGKPTAGAAAAGTASDSENIQEKSEAMDADQEVTKLVTTPDIQCYEDMEGPDTSNGTSKASSPPPPPPSLHHTLNKRGRKKQLHPQQVLTPERMKEVVNTNLIQCGLCDIVIPSNDESKHLQVSLPYIYGFVVVINPWFYHFSFRRNGID